MQRDRQRKDQSVWRSVILFIYIISIFFYYLHICIPALGSILPERLSSTEGTATGTVEMKKAIFRWERWRIYRFKPT